jgi:hypothetical protein
LPVKKPVKRPLVRTAFAIAAGTSMVVVIYACSFPNPTLILQLTDPNAEGGLDGSGGGDPDGATGEEVVVPSSPSAGLFEGGSDGNLPKFEEEAGVQVDASGCTTCDCDMDTFNRANCNNTPGPFDCDDTNSLYAPGQSPLTNVPPPARDGGPKPGDWNCDNNVSKFFTTNVKCGGLLPSVCEGIHGFETDPACGQSGTYVFCKKGALGLSCVIDDTRTRTEKQACQ